MFVLYMLLSGNDFYKFRFYLTEFAYVFLNFFFQISMNVTWRMRDVNTFVTTLQGALTAIVEQDSNLNPIKWVVKVRIITKKCKAEQERSQSLDRKL